MSALPLTPATPADTCPSICVVGGGPAGLAAALAMAVQGRKVRIVAPGLDPDLAPDRKRDGPSARADTRTTAVLGDGITLLQNLGVFGDVAAVSAPLAAIRIVDDRDGWLKAPEVLFEAREMGRTAFGYNIPNQALRAALLARVTAHPLITVSTTAGVTAIVASSDRVTLTTAENQVFKAHLLAAADGRDSIARAAAGIATRTWTYPQTAIALSFGHTRPHGGVSTELHRRAGPLTTVPLPDDAHGARSSLVWVETPPEATRLMALDDTALAAELQTRLRGLLGAVQNLGPRGTFAIAGLMATVPAKGRIALLGEAAHVLPPIGAQGLNLGLRDGATLADLVANPRADAADPDDPGAAPLIAAYAKARASDLLTREIGIDLLNRALLVDFPPVQAVRGLGLHALAYSRALRQAVMRMGLSAPGAIPALMRSSPPERLHVPSPSL